MIEKSIKIDNIDIEILSNLQKNGALSQRDLSDIIGMTQNACWRRIQRLRELGVLEGTSANLNRNLLGLDLQIFIMIRTRHHSDEWSAKFKKHVESIPQIIEFHRIGGDWDYLLKAIVRGMGGYDGIYQKLIMGYDLEKVTGYFSMETIFENRPLALK